MSTSRVRAASQTPGDASAAASPRNGDAPPRRRTAARRRADLRRAALWTLAVAAALVFNLVITLKVHAAGSPVPEDGAALKIATSRQATIDSRTLSAFGPQSERFGVKPYVEFGLTDRLAIGLGSETLLVKSGLESDRALRTDGLMNTELFLRGRLRDQDWYMLSVQDILRLPGQDADQGFTQADSSLRLQYGRSGRLGGGSWTSTVKGGFHPSLQNAPDKLKADLGLQWQPADKWVVSAQSLNTVALDTAGGAAPVPRGVESAKGQLSVTRNLTKALSVQVGGWQMVSGPGQPHGYDAIVWLRY